MNAACFQSRIRRCRIPAWPAWVLFACVLSSGLARAQDEPVPAPALPDTGIAVEDTSREARAQRDSLAALEFTAHAPRDSTGASFHCLTAYTVNRNTSNWSQKLNVDYRWHNIQVDNVTDITIREDTERRQRTGQRQQDLSLSYVGLPRTRVGLALGLTRNNDGSLLTGTLKENSSFLQQGLRAALAESLLSGPSTKLVVGVDGGRTSSDEAGALRRNASGSEYFQRLEFTHAPPGPMQVSGSMIQHTVRNEATGEQRGLSITGQDTLLQAQTQDRNSDFNATGRMRYVLPWHSLAFNLDGSHVASQLQQPTLGRQETLKQLNQNANGQMEFYLVSNARVNIAVRGIKNRVTSDVDPNREYDTRSQSGEANVQWMSRPLGSFTWGMVDRAGTNDFRSRIGGRLQTTTEHDLNATWKRQLGRFYASGNYSGALEATRYDLPIQDQDLLSQRLGGTLNYQVDGPFTLEFQASEVSRHTVYLNATQSSRNNINRLYSVSYNISYNRRGGVRAQQTYLITADATISDFDGFPGVAADNRYTRTVSYLTNFTNIRFGNAEFTMSHNLRVSASGSYDLDRGIGSRIFGQSGGGQNNDLNLGMSYRLTNWISATTAMHGQYNRQHSLSRVGREVPNSRQSILELNAGLRVRYTFREQTAFSGSFTRSSRSDTFISFSEGLEKSRKVQDKEFFVITAQFDLTFGAQQP